jgi:hypothetical protein
MKPLRTVALLLLSSIAAVSAIDVVLVRSNITGSYGKADIT